MHKNFCLNFASSVRDFVSPKKHFLLNDQVFDLFTHGLKGC